MGLSEEEARKAHSESIGRLFLQAHRDFQARVMVKLQSGGHEHITPAHLTALSQLVGGEIRMVDLAKRMKITKQSVSDLIHDLEVLGFVERQPDPRDKRAAILRFTPAGEAFLIDKLQIATEIDEEYRVLIGDEGFAQLVDLLKRVVEGGNRSGE